MRKQKALPILLILILIVSAFAGCGGDSASSAPAADETGAATPGSQATTSSEAPSGGVIKFATWQWGEAGFADFYRYACQEFASQNPGWTVEEVHYPYADYWNKMLADVSAGSPPDIFMGNLTRIGAYIAMGALEPFENWATAEQQQEFDTLFMAMNESPIREDGKTYALPMMLTSHQLIYNETLLADAGIAVPTTPEAFMEAAQALTQAPDQYGYGFMTLNEDAFYNDMMIWIMGEDENTIGGKVTVNTDGAVRAMTNYKANFDAQVTPIGVDKATYRNMFAQGKVAMLIDGPWLWGLLEQENPDIMPAIKSAVVPFPTKLSGNADNILFMASGGTQKETAWKLIELCATQEMQGKFVEYTNTTCGRTDAVPAQWLAENEWFQGFVDGAEGARGVTPMDYLEVEAQIRKLVIDAGQDILYNNTDPKARLDEAQAAIDAIYEAY